MEFLGKMDAIVHRGFGMNEVTGLMKSFIDMRLFPEVTYLENLGKYHFFKATGLLVLRVKLMEINRNLFSRYVLLNSSNTFFKFEERFVNLSL